MTATLGYIGVLIAAASSLVLAWRGLRSVSAPDGAGSNGLRLPVLGIVAGSVIAMVALEVALLADDFSLEYVADNSASTTPLVYKIATAWAALEGSIVLWGLVLAGFTYAAYRLGSRDQSDRLWSGAMGVVGVVALFFFVLMATVSNPFRVCEFAGQIGCIEGTNVPWAAAQAPAEGFGPNPLLQNHPLMAVHPPLLYVGYVGLTIPFAFAMSALMLGAGGTEWLRRTRTWTLVAWAFLTAGIVLGGLWSYEVLGWGGYWAWDPVENASFLPWLAATAFLHSSVVQRRRGMLQAWNFVLVIAAFALTILGTFLTRSGVINSVHSFTQSPIGPALLWFLAFVLVTSLGLFATRIHVVASSPRLDSLASREGVFLVNNLLLTVFAFVVLTGTLYPLFVEAFSGTQVGVGRPFFDRLAIPLSFLLLLAMGLGPVTPYRLARPTVVWERIRNPLTVALGAGAVSVLLGHRQALMVLAVMAGTFVVAVIVRHWWVSTRKVAAARQLSFPAAAGKVLTGDAGYWGGQFSHLGVAILAVGIAVSSSLSVDADVTLAPGETVEVPGTDFELTYVEPVSRVEPNRSVSGARIEVRENDAVRTTLVPRLNTYLRSDSPVATPSVDTGLRGDLYLSLRSLEPSQVRLEVFWFPFIWLVWVGGMLTAIAGFYSWAFRRRKTARERPAEVTADA